MTPPRHLSLRAAARIVAVLTILGVPAGAVWALLAPAVHVLVVAESRGVVLTTESLHRFDAVAIFSGIAIVLGVLSAVVVWGMRKSRGPGAVAALIVGSAAGAGVAALVGMGLAGLRYPKPEGSAVDTVVAVAPGLSTPLVLVAQPLAAALIYLLLVSLSPDDDLGVGDGERSVVAEEPATVDEGP
ncbi:uncharacterized protein DUF2567 [Rhodococcus sp. OK519]|uniref:DUF2567 domain-containing protein n=1 Tax=Rhodococcus sp. OK519 TaxID=2135729 RepID=UPI000D493170|nr:uncharacterized protein DUF2567 [Rhodococcus sp. OK519]